MFENHKPHHHKTAAALFFQSKKIFLPRFGACPDEQTAGFGRHWRWELGGSGHFERDLWFRDSGVASKEVRPGQQTTLRVIRTQSAS